MIDSFEQFFEKKKSDKADDKFWKKYKKALIKHATDNGFKKGLKSFDDLYKGGTVNAFGYPTDSVQAIKYYTEDDPENGKITIKRIQINDKYFDTPDKMKIAIKSLPIKIDL